MRIGIDISQLAYKDTGVANYLVNLIKGLAKVDKENEYILFFASMRKNPPDLKLARNFRIKKVRLSPTFLDLLWNKLHVFPIENFIGKIDVFITSDWTEPPVKQAKKATVLYDLIIYKYPEETHNKTKFDLLRLNILPNIVSVQKRKLKWVKKESDIVFCISEATMHDANKILGIDNKKLNVIYPGLNFKF